ncbi:MAG: hypothetical protein EXR72_01110 [Myxococcales bacterium]|nr:hypothetical protein [Myxococcales bacterium]
MRVGDDGKRRIILDGFNNPGGQIGAYLETIGGDPLDGFGTQSAVYFRFDAPLAPASLPATPEASVAAESTAFLIDVTPGSPTFGLRTPLRARFAADGGQYIGANALALLPEAGFPLRERTTYAAVLTNGLRAADSGPVHRDARFKPTLGPKYGVNPENVVAATSFTTQDATSIMKALRDAVYAQAPAPAIADFEHRATVTGLYDHYEGTLRSPNFQEGDPPYNRSGGRIHLGKSGAPEVVRTETLRFALTVPTTAMPPAGWPIVLYAHGTGGDFRSFINDGSAADVAEILDEDGKLLSRMAMISLDQVLHGPRDPSMANPDLTFFNFFNLAAAGSNAKQGALDDFQLLRLVENTAVAAAPKTGVPIKFDNERIYFKGHSQGGLTGPLFLAYEPKVKAAILSGAGANLILALVGKTEPVDIPRVVSAIVNEDIDEFHPLLTLLQTYLESTDPGNYARLFFREPPPGRSPMSIYQSMGLTDHFTPVPTVKALALAMGVQPVNPMLEPIDGLALASQAWGSPPLQANVAHETATGVVCEYRVPLDKQGRPAYDGHFVVFRHGDAVRQANAFLGTHARTGVARLIK